MVDLVRLPSPNDPGKSKKPKPQPSQIYEPEFTPPEFIKDDQNTVLPTKHEPPHKKGPKAWWDMGIKKLIALRRWWRKKPLKFKLAILAVFLVSMFGMSRLAVAYWPVQSKPWPAANLADYPKPEPKPTTEPSKLTGAKVKLSVNKQPVIGVMIENSPDARPQAGLRNAGVVYEAIAEGGITRFLALFLDETPGYIGPIRSARPYFIRWLLSYDAGYAHVGGSPEALRNIKSLKVRDLDQFHAPSIYHRESHRYAPHNMYSSIDDLMKLAKKRGYKSSDFVGFARKEKKSKPSKSPNAQTIDFDISSPLYNVRYRFDKKNNNYERSMGGQKHTDEKSGKQISADVVVAMITDYGIDSDGVHSVYRTTGKGRAYVFQNGRVAKVTWRKKSNKAKMELLDKAGEPFPLNPGKTWITVLGEANQVSYKK